MRKQEVLNRLDHRSPLVFDVRELGRRPGSMKRTSRTGVAPSDFGIEVIGVAKGASMELELRLEAVMEGVLVTGTVQAPLRGECVRCLEPMERELSTDFQEMYSYPDGGDRGRSADVDGVAEADEEMLTLDGDLFDLEPVLRDAVVLALPMQPVCREDCPGLCAECGARLADDPGHHHETIDTRWAALRDLAVASAAAGHDDDHDDDNDNDSGAGHGTEENQEK